MVRTFKYNGRSKWEGTSASCPHVSGVAGLMLSYMPGLTNAEVRAILQATAQINPDSATSNEWNEDFWNKYDGYGEVNAYYSLMYAQLLQGDWFPTPDVGDSGAAAIGIEHRPKVAVDGRGYTHLVYYQDLNGWRWYYNVLTPAGRILFNPPLQVLPYDSCFDMCWMDICVDAGNNAHLVWVEYDMINSESRLIYQKIDDGGVFVVGPNEIEAIPWESYNRHMYFEYPNVMVPDQEEPTNVYLVFDEYFLDLSTGIRSPNRIRYYKLNNQGQIVNWINLKVDNDSALTEVAADFGIKQDSGPLPVINMVWTDWDLGNPDIWWKQFNAETLAVYGTIQLTAYPDPSPDHEVQPAIDVDMKNAESYVLWVHKVPAVEPDDPYTVIEYVYLDKDGNDGCGWNERKVHEIGERITVGAYPGGQAQLWPQISHRTNLKVRDVVGDPKRTTSEIIWAEDVPGILYYDIVYTEITHDGRELLPDGDFKDGYLTGRRTITTSLYSLFSDIDSGFETKVNDLFDNSGTSRFMVRMTSNKYDSYSSVEAWKTPQSDINGARPDNCIDSGGTEHVAWESNGNIYYNQNPGSWRWVNDIVIYNDASDDGDDVRIVCTETDEGTRIHFIWQVEGETIYYAKYDANGNQLIAPTTLGCFGTHGVGWSVNGALDVAYDDRSEVIHVLWSGYEGFSQDSILYHGSIELDNTEYHPEAVIKNAEDDFIIGALDVSRDSFGAVVYWQEGDLYHQKISSNPLGARLHGSATLVHDKTVDGYAQLPDVMFDRDINRRPSNTQTWSSYEKNDESLHIVFMVQDDGLDPTILELHYIRLDKDGNEIVPEMCVYTSDYDWIQKSVGYPCWVYPEIALDENNMVHVIYSDVNFNDHAEYNQPSGQILCHVLLDINGQLITAPQILQKYRGNAAAPQEEDIALAATISIDSNGVLHTAWEDDDSKIFYSDTRSAI